MEKITTTTGAASIRGAIELLENLYQEMAPKFGLDGKAEPIILVQTAGRRSNVLGWMAPERWKTAANADSDPQAQVLNEISLCAEYLGRGALPAAETLIHEMVHHANALAGVKDVGSGQYHNKKFKTLAEAAGLRVEQMKGKGWAATSLGEDLRKELEALNLPEEPFAIFRRMAAEKEKAPTKMKKWECSCTIVRCATELNAVCDACGETFELQD